MKFQSDEISSTTLSRIPRRHNNRDTVVLKFGGTTLGSSKTDQRIRIARKTIGDLLKKGRHVVPVFSAFRQGRSGSREKFSVTDFLQNYRALIRNAEDADLAVKDYREKLLSVHQLVLRDLKIEGYGGIDQIIEKEISWVCRTISATSLAFEDVPSLNDSIVTAGERMAIEIIAAYLNRCHEQGKFPRPAKAVSALELGLYTDNHFGDAQIDWQRAIEHTRETVFAQYLDQGIVPVVSGFDGIYQQPCGFDEMVQSRTEKSTTSIPSNVYRTSLGRGGSDLTATFLGLALDAQYVGFCKETCGVLTGDDLMVGSAAQTVSQLTYDLATEAGNIYSKAVSPVRAAKIPIRIFDPSRPESQTIVSDVELPDGFYIIDRPKKSMNIHVGNIPDEPGALIKFLEHFARQKLNVEEIRHQRSGTDLIVCGDDAKIQSVLDLIHDSGQEVVAHFSWYIRIIGNVNEDLAADFNFFMRRYDPLSLAAYQLNTKVVTATVSRNRALDSAVEQRRVSNLILELHDQFVRPTASELNGSKSVQLAK